MKGIIRFGLLSLLIGCNGKVADDRATIVSIPQNSFDFGEITTADSIIHIFEIKNVGKNPLHIKTVTASCGCTKPIWSAEPIQPGNSGQVQITFKPEEDDIGYQQKSIVAYTNTEEMFHVMNLSGIVQE